METFMGYVRPDGQVGIRNYLLIIPSVVCAGHVVEKIAAKVPGAVHLANQYGCGQVGEDLKQTFRTLAGMGKNPNVGAVLIIGLGCEALRPEKLAQDIASSGKPVEMLIIQEAGGTQLAIEKGVEAAQKLAQIVAEAETEPCTLDKLILGLECGGSDFTSGLASNPALGYTSDLLIEAGGSTVLSETPEIIGAEHILSQRTKSPQVAEKLLKIVNDFEQLSIREGSNLRETQPSPGNRAGGITTIEEKSLGCIYKAGKAKVSDVIAFAEPVKEKGLTVMDTPGQDVQSMIGMLAGGVQIIAFTTGRGNPCGTPIAPVIKITANKTTYYHKVNENTDLYIGDLLEGKSTVEEEGRKIFQEVLAVCNGKQTRSEILEHREFGLWRIGSTY